MGGSKTVPRSSWFGPFFVLSFGIAFLVVLGSFWGRFWPLRGSFWCFFGISTHRFNPSTHQFVDSTHQLINPPIQLIKPSSHRFNPSTHRFNSSTHQPMALRHFLTRPGGLRAARLNPPPPEGSERVRTVFRISCQFLTMKPGHAHSAGPEFLKFLGRRAPVLKVLGPSWASKFGPKSIQKSIKILMSFCSRFWRLLGAFWPPFWLLLAAKIGPSSF